MYVWQYVCWLPGIQMPHMQTYMQCTHSDCAANPNTLLQLWSTPPQVHRCSMRTDSSDPWTVKGLSKFVPEGRLPCWMLWAMRDHLGLWVCWLERRLWEGLHWECSTLLLGPWGSTSVVRCVCVCVCVCSCANMCADVRNKIFTPTSLYEAMITIAHLLTQALLPAPPPPSPECSCPAWPSC